MRFHWVWGGAALLFTVLGLAPASWAQGFMVKPMKMEVAGRAGEVLEVPLQLRLTAGEEAKPLDLALLELTQDGQGNWSVVEPGSDVDISKLASCREWITLGSTSVTVRPAEAETVTVRIAIPHRARGVYFAGIIAQTRRPEQQTGVAVVVRFLIPVIVEIQGRPERQNVQMAGMRLTRIEPVPAVSPGSTTASMSIENQGRTLSRLKANVRVQRYSDGRWKPVSTVDLREVGIIPGVTLNLTEDIKKRLPSGKYRLTGLLYVDGRRMPPMEQEVEFEGDPAVTTLAADTALALEPQELTIAGAPGATRTAVLQVTNESEEAVQVEAAALLPPTLRGVALGELTGDKLSAAQWLQVSPPNFKIRGGGKQNVRVVARLPRDGMDQANYYGLLSLKASYPDGQSAGQTTALTVIQNSRAESAPKGEVVRAGLALEDGSRYIVQGRISNVGNVHVTPSVRAVLLDGRGDRVTETPMEGDASVMLPLATRNFAGVIDFEKIEDGAYLLRVDFTYATSDPATQSLPIRVATEQGQKVVTVIESQQEQSVTQPATQPATPNGASK